VLDKRKTNTGTDPGLDEATAYLTGAS